MYPGDPTTPGEPAYPNATRVEGTNIPSIPSLPLSYEDAIPILKALHGKGIAASDLDPSFTGGLGFYGVEEYFTGPSDVDLHLVNEVNTRIMPIWNTMAVIPGYIQDEVVVMGNHRDAWVLGGSDPNSGSSSQYEMVRGLGKLLKKGWRPLRSIVLASWDAEEYGLVGSTEWAEDFGSWLEGNAAAYLNLDASSSGSNFGAAASPTLARVVRSAAEDVEKGSDSSRSVWDARSDGGDWAAFWTNSGEEGETEMMRTTSDDGSNTGIAPLGSGSDYTAFLMRYGVASTDFSFGGGPKDPVYHYHSIYDSHTWLARYGDPGFHKHTEGAKIIGLIALRVADSLILPFNTTQYAYDLDGYLARIVDIKNSDEDFATLDLDSLSQAISQLKTASAKYDTHRVDLLHKLHDILHKRSSFPARWHQFKSILDRIWNGTPTRALVTWDSTPEEIYYAEEKAPTSLPPHKRKQLRKVLQDIRAVNRRLRAFESGFIGEQGITDREWYKHKGTAPGKWLGYGATTVSLLKRSRQSRTAVTSTAKQCKGTCQAQAKTRRIMLRCVATC
jgi:N-acetylated-alpha-linked acidic dipeptidase